MFTSSEFDAKFAAITASIKATREAIDAAHLASSKKASSHNDKFDAQFAASKAAYEKMSEENKSIRSQNAIEMKAMEARAAQSDDSRHQLVVKQQAARIAKFDSEFNALNQKMTHDDEQFSTVATNDNQHNRQKAFNSHRVFMDQVQRDQQQMHINQHQFHVNHNF